MPDKKEGRDETWEDFFPRGGWDVILDPEITCKPLKNDPVSS